ncbi:MAG: 4'-phosphopantetheinyl transferase family protein [Caldilineaceae bacterium]
MIHWLIQPGASLPADAEEALGPIEGATYARFTLPKRRSDWLLGRHTAKQLVQQALAQAGQTVALTEVEIVADGDGAPVVWRVGERLPLCLSISHSHNTAFCALMEQSNPGESLGADIEFIEPRDTAFVADFFTAREQAQIAAAPPEARDRLVTATWSAKEAVLKALREGLRIDTKLVECFFDNPADDAWTPYTIVINPALNHPRAGGRWSGWWRTQDRFVLTLAERSAAL